MAKHRIPQPGQQIQLGDFLAGSYRFPAVYLLHLHGEIVYVGQSKTLRWRIETHLEQGLKSFDAVSFAPCPVSQLLLVEGYYIRKHTPKYNRCRVAESTRRDAGGKRNDAFAASYLARSGAVLDGCGNKIPDAARIAEKRAGRHRNRRPQAVRCEAV